jgi:hypothetical protein
VSTTVEETLAWEAEQRPRAATIAVAGGIATVGGNVLFTAITAGAPSESDGFITFGESLGAHLEGNRPEEGSLVAGIAEYFGDNVVPLALSTVLIAIALVGLAMTTLFLYRATYARFEQVGRLPYYAALAGLFLAPVGHLLWQLPQWIGAAGFVDEADKSAGAARDALSPSVSGFGGLIAQLGLFPLALAVILVSLNAMRAGLLTRFFGVLGMIAGVLTLLGSQFDQPGIVRAFWLVGVGLIIAGRMRVPPAWETGRAEPWPTQQQLREQREAERGGGRGKDGGGAGKGDDRPANGGGESRPQGQRRKRKRRR